MGKNILIAALAALGITGLLWWGGSGQASLPDQGQAGASALTTAETLHDFGLISMKNGTVETLFEVTNPTNKDITVERLTTSCMCTVVYIVDGDSRRGPFGMPGHGSTVPRANEVVSVGETLTLAVVYDPNAHGPAGVGPVDRFVYLEDEAGAVLELEIKANVTP